MPWKETGWLNWAHTTHKHLSPPSLILAEIPLQSAWDQQLGFTSKTQIEYIIWAVRIYMGACTWFDIYGPVLDLSPKMNIIMCIFVELGFGQWLFASHFIKNC